MTFKPWQLPTRPLSTCSYLTSLWHVAVYKLERDGNKAIVLYITALSRLHHHDGLLLLSGHRGQRLAHHPHLPTPSSSGIYCVTVSDLSHRHGPAVHLTFEIMFFAALAFLFSLPLFNETASNLWLHLDFTSIYEHLFLACISTGMSYQSTILLMERLQSQRTSRT